MTPKRHKNLRRLLRPRHIAFVGGRDVATVINQCRRIGYSGALWPVNPSRKAISGITCFANIDALPEAPDAVFLAVPKKPAIETVAALTRRGAGGVVCYTAGFSEIGGSGEDDENRLIEAAEDMALVGPNCYGLINYHDKVALWPFAHSGIHPGYGAAIVTQSGMLSSDLIMSQRHLPLSFMVSAGNQAILRLEDFIEIFIDEPHVRAIGLHIEAIQDAQKFADAARRALEKNIPIVALKTGVSKIGAQLTTSHTGSLSGTDTAYSAFFKRLGISRVSTPVEFIEVLKFFTVAGIPTGRRIAGLTCSGGGATMLADYAAPLGLDFKQPSPSTALKLQTLLPHTATVSNPLDYTTPIWGDYDKTLPVFQTFLEDEYDSTVIVQDYPATGLDESKPYYRSDSDSFIKASHKAKIPAAICSTIPENLDGETREHILYAGIAPMQGIDTCMRAIGIATTYGEQRKVQLATPALPLIMQTNPAETIQHLNEGESKTFLKKAGLAVPDMHIINITDFDSGVLDDISITFPVAAKICSPDIPHKTEIGALKLGINSKKELKSSIAAINAAVAKNAPDARHDGFLIETMIANPIVEMMLNIRREMEFGLVLTIASGGVLAELLNDSETVIMPAHRAEINMAISSLKIARLLDGFRGGPVVSREPLHECIHKLFTLIQTQKNITEIEINPLMVGVNWAVCADALISKA